MSRRQLTVAIVATLLISGSCAAGSAQLGAYRNTPAGQPGRPHAATRTASPTPSPSPTALQVLATEARAPGHGTGPSHSLKSTGTRAVALTFDDGPDPRWTPTVLALLARYHLHATFCLIGEEVRAHPKLVARIVAQGNSLCNHSWDHDEFLYQKSTRRIRAEMTSTSNAIHRAAPDAPIRYYRQPGGNWSRRIVAQARSLGMAPLHWSVDPSDWRRPPVGAIISNVEANTRPGAIVLMHDAGGDRSHTCTALRTLLPYLHHRYDLIRL